MNFYNKTNFTFFQNFDVSNSHFSLIFPNFHLFFSLIEKTMLLSVFRTGECFFKSKRIFKVGQDGQDKKINTACLQDRGTLTLASEFQPPKNFDLHVGKTRWESESYNMHWIKKKDLEKINFKQVLTDEEDPVNCFYAISNLGLVRKYDMRIKPGNALNRKPVLQTSNFQFGKNNNCFHENFICMRQHKVKKHLLGVGGTHGSLFILDTRKIPETSIDAGTEYKYPKPDKGSNAECVVKVFRSVDCPISDVAFNSSTGFAVASQDKKVRVYDINTSKLTCDLYLKTKFSSIWFNDMVDGKPVVDLSRGPALPVSVKKPKPMPVSGKISEAQNSAISIMAGAKPVQY